MLKSTAHFCGYSSFFFKCLAHIPYVEITVVELDGTMFVPFLHVDRFGEIFAKHPQNLIMN